MKKVDLANEPQGMEKPLPSEGKTHWGSDAMAEVIRSLDIPYVALNPGSSYRGLHDSLVNKLGNERPQMLLCLHEEAAVAIAHGWAKVTEKPMLAVVHANVGLMHGSMAVYNAWCDRAPLVLLGANGPARCEPAPAVDRLDPHHARQRRLHPQLHQVGRPAGLDRRRL